MTRFIDFIEKLHGAKCKYPPKYLVPLEGSKTSQAIGTTHYINQDFYKVDFLYDNQ